MILRSGCSIPAQIALLRRAQFSRLRFCARPVTWSLSSRGQMVRTRMRAAASPLRPHFAPRTLWPSAGRVTRSLQRLPRGSHRIRGFAISLVVSMQDVAPAAVRELATAFFNPAKLRGGRSLRCPRSGGGFLTLLQAADCAVANRQAMQPHGSTAKHEGQRLFNFRKLPSQKVRHEQTAPADPGLDCEPPCAEPPIRGS